METATTELLTISGMDAAVSATDAARATRDALLSRARRGTAITSATSAESAGAMLKEIKTFTRAIEDSRKEVKEPVLEISRQIDGLAKELTTDLDAEAARISRLVGAWQAEQNRLAEEQRRKAWAAEQEIKRAAMQAEREAADRLAAEQAELQAKAARARTLAGKERAELEMKQAERRAAEEQQARIDAQARELVEAQQQIMTTAPKPAGLSTREEICFEVTDLTALYEAAPFLVSLTPNNAAIKSAIKGLTGNQTLPGVRHWKEQKAIVR